jgi:transposase
MVVVGTDVHKRTHTFVAVDEVGKKLGSCTVPATRAGHQKALLWALTDFGPISRWGVEDCRNMSAQLERDLLGAGQMVVRVPPKLMAEQRRTARTRGKSDPIDALATARVVVREPDLPLARHDEVSRELRLLVDRRETLVRQRTATINSLLWRVHELDCEYIIKSGALTMPTHQKALQVRLAERSGIVAELARDELSDIIDLTVAINALHKRINTRVRVVAPSLLTVVGCAGLTAAKLVGETADVTRFATEAQFARHAGVAPIPVWSGRNEGRVRMTRSGNRQLNAALHRIAITQIRCHNSLGRVYYDKKIAEGKTTREALRCLKRKLVPTVFKHLVADHHARTTPAEKAAA